MKAGDKIKPKSTYLSGKGYMWEMELGELGFNELPEDHKFGIIETVGYNPMGAGLIWKVYWPYIDLHQSAAIFPDEVKFLSDQPDPAHNGEPQPVELPHDLPIDLPK